MSKTSTQNKIQEIRELAESDLITFIRLVHPMRLIGALHEELARWWDREEAKTHQVVLLPRDHGKSAYVAYRVAQAICKNPAIRVLYISSTANLATKQLKFIKDILSSKVVRKYWPGLVNEEEGKREKWTETEIAIDHPLRKKENIRDSTVFTAGLTTGITGLHCDIAVMDDVVVKENAYTEEGRNKVRGQYSLLSSIEGTHAQQWVVGTRYDPNDLYNDLAGMKVELYDDLGNIISSESLYEVFEKQVEDSGIGNGEFIWPMQQRYDGKWFGFNQEVLARKRTQYLDQTQFRAQYYNNPNDMADAPVSRELFQYYNRNFLEHVSGYWHYNNNRLNVFAAVDFAFSLRNKADFTAIVVVGVDQHHNYYILDIRRFKTESIREYFENILSLHTKWDFRKLRAEVSVGQKVIVETLKNEYIRDYGLSLSIDEFRPTRNDGSKSERIMATLNPRYENRQIWHYQGGNCQILEEELVMRFPTHDDVKDALTAAIDVARPPSSYGASGINSGRLLRERLSHPKFGGIG